MLHAAGVLLKQKRIENQLLTQDACSTNSMGGPLQIPAV
jgi:hypothetical protein